MRLLLVASGLSLVLAACVIDDGSDPCDAPAELVSDVWRLDGSNGQAYLTTPPAAGTCHAVFVARLGYTGDDGFDPTLPVPQVDVSANAAAVDGSQAGVVGLLIDWRLVEDESTSEVGWWAELDAGARNIDAPAVTYGMAALRLPGETRVVEYQAEIEYRPPPSDRAPEAARCRP